MKCLWTMDDLCSDDVETRELFNGQITVAICGTHFKQHQCMMELHKLGQKVEDLLAMSSEERDRLLEQLQNEQKT